ncbi:hypothetical protein FCIRC_13635 [Fusarium circinatum]|uniref:NAD(P)-binding domain-containing protein n=1 Tax=Fusarium circinatum TaxID=48490 RepID=A0A8H5ST17_FUSCI|nr:hypothetical protein FCIRC_13635 [Fusarium circinatum]
MESTKKSIPKSILIFGAAGHIGQPLAEFLTREAPDIQLSLVARNPEKQKLLQNRVPNAHVLAADYEDPSSLAAAVKGIEGVFVISSSGMSETTAMTNLSNVLKQDGSAVHIIRLLGIFPEFNPRRVPASLGPGSLPYEHPIAKRILDESDLPVTYINSGATFIDNLWLQIQPVLLHKKFIWPEHRVPFLDPRDVAEVAGRLFLSDNAKHVVTGILSDELGESLAFDGSYEGFMEFWGPRMGKKAERIWNFFKFEQANEEQWALNNFVERILGRKPTTVRGWVVEHKDALVKGDRTVSWA